MTKEEEKKFETMMIGGCTLAATVIGAAAMAFASATGYLAAHAHIAASYSAWVWILFGALGGGLTALRFTLKQPRQVILPAVFGGAVLLSSLAYLLSDHIVELWFWVASLSVGGAALYGAISMAVIGAFASTVGVILTRDERS